MLKNKNIVALIEKGNMIVNIGQRIKIKREIKGITLETLSKDVGVSRQTLSRYETGVIQNIPSDKIELIAKALNTTPAYLMGWQEIRETEKNPLYKEEEDEIKRKIVEALDKLNEGQKNALLAMIETLKQEKS